MIRYSIKKLSFLLLMLCLFVASAPALATAQLENPPETPISVDETPDKAETETAPESDPVDAGVMTSETELFNDKAVTVSGKKGDKKYFFIKTPTGARELEIKTSGGSGDADLYVRFGSQPTKEFNDCKSIRIDNNETCILPKPQVGKYYIGVFGYEDFSQLSLVVRYKIDMTPEPGPELTNGQSITISGNRYEFQHFFITIPNNAVNFVVKLSGGSGDADLYTQRDIQPTYTAYLCRPHRSGNDEQCSIVNPTPGKYYVSVYTYAPFIGVTLTASYETANQPPQLNEQLINHQTIFISAAAGEWKYFYVDIPGNTYYLTIKTSFGTGNIDLYRKFDVKPILTIYDCRSMNAGTTENCYLDNPGGPYESAKPIQAGRYYIGVYANEAFKDVGLTTGWR